jgi:dihydrofolate synthase/folylpolyglutamate synthase
MRLDQAEAWLEGLVNLERSPDLRHARLSLTPIRALLARTGEPHDRLHVLHIAGSKGKGSTALLCEALLREAGVSTGTFTSPHLERWTERFRLDGREVPGDALAAVLSTLRPHVEALREGPEPPSFFDVTTAAAFQLFADAGVEAAVVEVGLGGRLDSTNVVAPAVCCITSIELEHTERLGDTLAAIAGEKAGIVKSGIPLVVGALPAEAAAVVEARARELACPLARLGHELRVELLDERIDGSRFRFADGAFSAELELAAPGRHQVSNAALALASVRRLDRRGERWRGVAERAFPRIVLPGRVEICARAPWIIVDGAHTECRVVAVTSCCPFRPGRISPPSAARSCPRRTS